LINKKLSENLGLHVKPGVAETEVEPSVLNTRYYYYLANKVIENLYLQTDILVIVLTRPYFNCSNAVFEAYIGVLNHK